jgi:molybdopterin-biosynthesis enzyme MoeA-like protein
MKTMKTTKTKNRSENARAGAARRQKAYRDRQREKLQNAQFPDGAEVIDPLMKSIGMAANANYGLAVEIIGGFPDDDDRPASHILKRLERHFFREAAKVAVQKLGVSNT